MNYFATGAFCLTGVALAAAPAEAKTSKEGAPPKGRPNLLFIMADQWRADFMGFRGVVPVQTPNLDNLAKAGVSFNQAMSCYPVSSPSRACWLTGMYPIQNHVTGNCNSTNTPYGVEMAEDAECWSDVLKKEGYATGYIGKWHLDAPVTPYVDTHNNKGPVAWNEWCPPNRRHGFDYWLAYGTYDEHLRPMYWKTNDTRENFFFVDEWGPTYEANMAISYIDSVSKGDKPFVLAVSMNPPHTGYQYVPQKYKDIYQNLDVEALATKLGAYDSSTPNGKYFRRSIRNYMACITGVDHEVGRIADHLRQKNLFDNTIIVFVSDHGAGLGIKDIIEKNIYYEEAVAIPLIVSYPAKIRHRVDNQLQISIADLYPTLLSIMGMKDRIPQSVMSYNLDRAVVSGRGFHPEFQPYYKIDAANPKNGLRGIRNNRYTLAIEFKDGAAVKTFLFDRVADPLQLTNIAESNPKLTAKLTKQLSGWLKKTNDPISMN